MFLTMFFKTQNIEQTMHLTMLIAHPYTLPTAQSLSLDQEDDDDDFQEEREKNED